MQVIREFPLIRLKYMFNFYSFIKDSNSSVLFKNFRLSDYESENEAQRNLFKENYEKMLKDKKQYGDIP